MLLATDPYFKAPKLRTASYACNWWILHYPPTFNNDGYIGLLGVDSPQMSFSKEEQVNNPSTTPTMADGINPWVIPLTPTIHADSFHPDGSSYIMSAYYGVDIPELALFRHGSHPNHVPSSWPMTRRLPGAINVAFFDGHVQFVPLDNLWQLQWNRTWNIPAKRPGLP